MYICIHMIQHNTHIYIYTHTYSYNILYMYMYMCIHGVSMIALLVSHAVAGARTTAVSEPASGSQGPSPLPGLLLRNLI